MLEALEKSPEGIVYDPEVEHRKFESHPFPTPSGKFEFITEGLKSFGCSINPTYEPPEYLKTAASDFPLRMITGSRKAIYYHSRYREIEKFKTTIPRAQVEIHADDAVELDIQDGDMVRIVSKIGKITIQAKVVQGHRILKGFVEVPHGWNDPNVNRLT
ncbi:MAG: hypothetical protein N2F24_06460, partial [Deltaproteobacteria bacterium]